MSIASIVKRKHGRRCPEWTAEVFNGDGTVVCRMTGRKMPCNGVIYGNCHPTDWEVEKDGNDQCVDC